MAPIHGFKSQEIIEQGRVDRETLQQLRKWCDEHNLSSLTDEQLVLFLSSCSGKLEASQNTIKSFIKIRQAAPELFCNRHYDDEDLQQAMQVMEGSVLPVRTSDNDVITLWRFKDTVYHRFILKTSIKLTLVVGESIFYQNPPDGIITIVDLRGTGLLHFTRFKLCLFKIFFSYVQEAYYCKVKTIHFICPIYFGNKLIFLLKPFIKEELFKKITLHSSNTTLIQQLSVDLLPEDYGGVLPDQTTLSIQTYNSIRGLKKFFKDEEEQIKLLRID